MHLCERKEVASFLGSPPQKYTVNQYARTSITQALPLLYSKVHRKSVRARVRIYLNFKYCHHALFV